MAAAAAAADAALNDAGAPCMGQEHACVLYTYTFYLFIEKFLLAGIRERAVEVCVVCWLRGKIVFAIHNFGASAP